MIIQYNLVQKIKSTNDKMNIDRTTIFDLTNVTVIPLKIS